MFIYGGPWGPNSFHHETVITTDDNHIFVREKKSFLPPLQQQRDLEQEAAGEKSLMRLIPIVTLSHFSANFGASDVFKVNASTRLGAGADKAHKHG